VGIGLALVKELVDIMGGRIDVKSTVAQGTTIRVWLPDKWPSPKQGEERPMKRTAR
jgi:signal transduction histidine kinase